MIGQSTPFNEAALTGRRDWLDAGAGNARIEIYGNTRPGTAGGTAGASPLVTIPLSKPCGTVSGGFLTLIADDPFVLASGSGAPVWGRVYNADNQFGMDCDAGTIGDTAEIIVSEPALYLGGKVTLIVAAFG